MRSAVVLIAALLLLASGSTAFLTPPFRGRVSPPPDLRTAPCDLFHFRTRSGSTRRHSCPLYAAAVDPPPSNNITGALALRSMAVLVGLDAFRRNPTTQPLDTAVRLSTAAVTWLEIAPMTEAQWRNTTQALATNPTESRKFWRLVRLRTIGQLLGLGVILAPSGGACLGAAMILTSHVLFWMGGGGSARVDASGNAAPLPRKLVKTIFTADATVGAAALVGAVARPSALRVAGALLYSFLVSALCFEQLKKTFLGKKGRKETKSDDESSKLRSADPGNSSSGRTVENDSKNASSALVLPEWKFDWRTKWYPLAFSKSTAKDIPHRLELFGDSLVLWYDGTQWAALGDTCPHRLAPLSEGRIDNDGQIECPYHGWTFTNEGTCTKIPQAPANSTVNLNQCSAQSYRVVEKQGIIWVWGQVGATEDEADESLLPLCPALEDDRFVWIDFSRDLPYSADTLLENVLDSSHVPFTHHKTISRREAAKPLPFVLTTPISPTGFEGEMTSDVAIGEVGEANAKKGRVTERPTVFVAPTYMHHQIKSADVKDMDFDAGFETWTVVYATPTGPGRSRLLARFPFRFPPPKRRFFKVNLPPLIFKYLPDWVNHLGQLKVTDDDNIFLPMQERRREDVGGWTKYRMPTDADEFIRGYRRWLDKAGPPPYAISSFDVTRMSPPSKEQLLDRKSQHTVHCKSCSGALKNAGRVRGAMSGVLFACLAVSPNLVVQKAWKSLIGLAVAFVAFTQVRRAAMYVETSLTTGLADYPPPRNRPDMKGKSRELRTVEEGRMQ